MIVKDRKLPPNADKPTLFFAEPAIPLVFEFDSDLPTGTTFTLAVDVERKRIITGPMASAVGAVSGKKLTFALNTLTDRFDIMSQTNADTFVEIFDATGKVYLQDRLLIAPRVDVDGIPPQQLAKYPTVTAMNEAIAAAETAFLAKSSTFTGAITIQRDSSSLLTVKCTAATGYSVIEYVGTARSFSCGVGNATATIEALRNCWYVYDQTAAAPRLTISPAGLLWASDISISGTASLVAKLAEIDAALASGGSGNGYVPVYADYLTEGQVNILDGNVTELKLIDNVSRMKSMKLQLISSTMATSGNIVLVPYTSTVTSYVPYVVTWTAGTPVVVPVTGSATVQEIVFPSLISGRFKFVRDTANALDTLKSGGQPVAALVITIEKRSE